MNCRRGFVRKGNDPIAAPGGGEGDQKRSLIFQTHGRDRVGAGLRYLLALMLVAGGVGAAVMRAEAARLETAFAEIEYSEKGDLQRFRTNIAHEGGNDLALKGPGLSAIEIGLKLSRLVRHVQTILEMPQEGLHFKIKILATPQQVQRVYQQMYGRETDYIAFYSPGIKTVFLAASTLRHNVIVHEIAHVIVDRYFGKAPPVMVHELLAQYAERQL